MSVSLAFELKSIRAKLVRLLEVYQSINQVQVPISEWPYWIEKFNALASQYQSLMKELTLALDSAVLEPSKAEGNTDQIPGVLLRSRLPPEVVEACKSEGNNMTRPDMSLIEEFSELRDAFEVELKANQPFKDRQPVSVGGSVESSISFLYTGKP